MFRLDRFRGRVDEIAYDSKADTYIWQSVGMSESALSKFVYYKDDRVHFQIFSSGMIAKLTFLMDVDTSVSWILVVDKNGGYWWQLVGN